ncbi:neuroglobin-like [Sceloporus undulatus]|uniref:neuroglobin-like n=1 Tax=Sceloporus undulatus TaxID=8520 RepID=UPI001C4C7C0E|nr:neuroglobin-like [Sceloporus undulatus]
MQSARRDFSPLHFEKKPVASLHVGFSTLKTSDLRSHSAKDLALVLWKKRRTLAGRSGLWLEMGCALSGSGVTQDAPISEEKPCSSLESGFDLNEETELGGDEEATESFPLSEVQKELIRESWKILHKDIARVGIIVFIRLFETHPECKDVFFLFRDIDDLHQLKMSKELQAHGLRVMSFIEKSVARLDQEEKLEHLAFELGRSHCRYKAPPKYYEYIGTQFIQAVQPILKETWTPEIEKAWESLFQYLAATMRRGFYKEQQMTRTK